MKRRRDLRRNQTDAEKTFWKCIRGRQLQGLKFLRQYSVGLYILDFHCPAVKLAVELDGGQHNDEQIGESDRIRSEFLQTQGIAVLRFWNHKVLQQTEAHGEACGTD
jgi:very-short-patch-repair endonuclease